MKKIKLIVLLLPFFIMNGYAQEVIQGRVLDEETKQAIPNASVYINNTSIGMKTNDIGAFRIYPQKLYKDLVISVVGYEKTIVEIRKISTNYTIYLKRKENTLNEVNITFDKNAWKKWGDIFSKILLGAEVQYSKGCEIMNPKDVNFYYDEDEGSLTVTTDKTLVVKNIDLGYNLNIDIDNFKYFFIDDQLLYSSTVNYEELNLKGRKKSNIQISTNYTYYGSKRHFYQSLYNKKLEEEGFTLCAFEGKRNIEKDRVTAIVQKRYAKMISKGAGKREVEMLADNLDSAIYYRKILRQSDFLVSQTKAIDVDQYVRYDTVHKTINFNFPDTLLLTYTRNNSLLSNFTDRKKPDKNNMYSTFTTLLYLTGKDGAEINEAGFSNNNVLFTIGDIGDRRFSRELPLSYEPKIGRKLD